MFNIFYTILEKYDIEDLLDENITKQYKDMDFRAYPKELYLSISNSILALPAEELISENVGLPKAEQSILSLKTRTYNNTTTKIVEHTIKGRHNSYFANKLQIASSLLDRSVTKSEASEKLTAFIVLTTLLANS